MSRVDEARRRADGAVTAIDGHARNRAREHATGILLEEYPVEGRPVEGRAPARAQHELGTVAVAAPRTGTARPLGQLAQEVQGKVVIDSSICVTSIEEYRRLAGTLLQLQAQSGLRVLMISSALPRDGKTLTSTNLSLTLSEAYKRRVLLIDADLRRPSIHHVFTLPNTRGLADGLRGESAEALPLIEVSPQLSVLPAGSADHNPMAGLTSERMGTLVKEAASRFDWVIIDTPPIGLMSDARLLAAFADGVLLVIGAGSTDYHAVKRAVAEFGRDRILGIVLNRVEERGTPSEYYRHYYYGSHEGGQPR